MPQILQTVQGIVTGLWGTAVIRLPDGSSRPLKMGDVVNRGDLIVTSQDGIVQLTSAESDAAPRTAAAPDNDVERVIADLNAQNPLAATAAGPAGGDGAGELTPGLRVDRVVEATTPASFDQPTATTATPAAIDTAAANPNVTAPVQGPPLSAGSSSISASEEGPAVDLRIPAPANAASDAVVTIDKVPTIGLLEKADGSIVAAGSVLTTTDLQGLKYVPPADYDGTAPVGSFDYTITSNGETALGSTRVSLVAIDDAPVARADVATTAEDTPVSGNVLANDTDVDGPSLAVTQFSVAGVAGSFAAGSGASIAGIGVLRIGADGAFTFTPAADYHGAVPVATYTVSDGSLTSTATLTINLGAVNDAPTARPNTASTALDTPTTIAVIGNDSDVDGDALKVNAATVDPTKGTVSINPDGTLVFTPATNVSGPVVVSYTISDPSGATSTSTVTVNVGGNTPPTGADSVHATAEDTPYVVRAADFGFADADAGQTLAAVRIDSLPVNGALLLNGVAVAAGQTIAVAELTAGHLTLAPASNGNGSPYASFNFSVQDSAGAFDTVPNTLTLNVTPVNDAPIARDDSATTAINTPVTVAVLGNDSDVDGDSLTVKTATVDPLKGTVVVNPDGTLTFTPAADVVGPVAINYAISDPAGLTSTATVTVNIGNNTPPTGADSTHGVAEDTSYTVRAADFGFADADAGQTLAVVRIDSLPAAGALLLNGAAVTAGQTIAIAEVTAGHLVLAPAADGNGAPYASFTFSVQDNAGAFDVAPNKLTLDVTPVNDAPVAHDDVASTPINAPVTVAVLGNDTDVDGDTLHVTTATVDPLKGTVTLNPDGTLAFTPATNVSGPVAITYVVADPAGLTSTATVIVNIGSNAPPTGADATRVTAEDTSYTVQTGDFGFADADACQTLAAVRIDSLPANGTLLLNGLAVTAGQTIAASEVAAGHLSFAPTANGNGAPYASFTFSVQDNAGAFDVSPNKLTLDVTPVNDAPVAHNDTASTAINTPVNVTVLGNDTDVDGDVLHVTAATVDPLKGTVKINPDGTLALTPATNVTGPVTINYTIADPSGLTSSATVTVNIGSNTPPAGADAVRSTAEDTTYTVHAADFGFVDADAGQTLAGVRIDTLPATGALLLNGTAVLAGQTIAASEVAAGHLAFAPAANGNGAPYASFTFSVQDNMGTFDVAPNKLTLDVTPVNDAPVAHDDTATTAINTPVNVAVLGNDTDVDGDALHVTAATVDPLKGTVTINPDGTLAFTPANNVTGPVVINYTVSDPAGLTSSAIVSVNVGGNTAPDGADGTRSTPEDTPYVVKAADFGFTDADAGQTLGAVRIDTPPVVGSLLLNGAAVVAGQTIAVAELTAGHLTFAPAANGNGSPYASFTFSVQDSAGAFDASPNKLTLNVTPVNDAPVAADDSASTAINSPVNVNVLGNDTDVDGDVLHVTAATVDPLKGTVTIKPDGTLDFTPANNVTGPVTINYTIADPTGLTSSATVTVTIGTNTPPTGADSAHTIAEDSTYTVQTTDFGFTDADAGQTLAAVRIDTLPATGSLLLNGVAVTAGQTIAASEVTAGHLVLAPSADGNGSPYASFTFSVQDSAGAFDASPNKLTLNVTPVNDAPVAVNDSASTAINAPVNVNVLGNDVDVDGDVLHVTAATVDPLKGTVTIKPDGTLDFTPANNVTGPVTINYTIADPVGLTSNATVTVTIGTNTPPTGADSAHTIAEDSTYTVQTTDFGFTDADAGQTLAAVRIDTLPATGSLLLNGVAVTAGQTIAASEVTAGHLVLAPTANGNGSPYASFTFSVQDSAGAFDASPNKLTLNVTPVNDPPTLSLDADHSHNVLSTQAITGLFNTGQSAAGTALADGTIDPHYALISKPAGSTVTNTVTDANAAWVRNDADSAWVGNASGEQKTGLYQYQTGFTLQAGADPASVHISFDLSTDNTLRDIIVNGVSTGFASDVQYSQFTHVVLDGGSAAFQSGANTITFVIDNRDPGYPASSGPTGLRIDNMNATVVVVGPDAVNHQGDYATTYVEGHPVSIADVDLRIQDVDNTTLQGAVITLTNAQSGDTLWVGALPVGMTASINAAGTVVTLGGSASLADYQAAIRAVQFSNSSETPSGAVDRLITVVVNDGQASSNTTTTTVHVVPVDDSPVLDLDGNNSTVAGTAYAGSYTTNQAAVGIVDTDVAIADVDSTTLHGATIHVTNAQAGDVLSAGSLPAGIKAALYDPINGVLTLSGTGTLAQYQAALQSVGFSSSSASTVSRTIEISVNDGSSSSAIALSTIGVTAAAVNHSPVAVADTTGVAGNASVSANAAAGVLANDTDVDPGDTKTVSAISFGGASGTVGSAVNGTYGTLTLNADGSYSYVANHAGAVPAGTSVNDVFTYQVSDGHGGTAISTLTMQVAGAATTSTAGVPTVTALTSTLGLNGEYYGYNDSNPTSSNLAGFRQHSDDGTVGNLDHVSDFNTLVDARNAAYGAGAVIGTQIAATTNAVDARFIAKTIDYGAAPTVANSLGTNADVAAGANPGAVLTDGNSSLWRYIDRAGGSQTSTLTVEKGTADNDALGTGPTSGLGSTTDAGMRFTGEAYMAAGVYDIRVTADDGFRLNMGGHTVAIYDDIQAPTTRVYTDVPMVGGMTPLELLYWEQGGNAVLKIEYKLSGSSDAAYQTLGSDSLPLFSESAAPALTDTQSIVGAGSGSYNIVTGSVLNGTAGDDTIAGNTANDKLIGGNGNDLVSGGAGDDILIGGKGNDTLTGGTGHDVFRWQLGDAGTTAAPAHDVVTDFNNASYSGSVLDLRDLLVGETHAANVFALPGSIGGTNGMTVTADTGNLNNFIHFTVSGADTVVEISSTGGFTGGTFNGAAIDQTITLQGINLVGAMNNDQVLNDLLKRGKLVTDGS